MGETPEFDSAFRARLKDLFIWRRDVRRFRHTAQFSRWRPDREPRSCTYEQLDRPVQFALNEIVPGLGHA